MRKILFNDKFGLTQAVLDGTKTMTRRFIPIDETRGGLIPISYWEGKWCSAHGRFLKRQPYKIGEILAIAQPYKDLGITFAPYADPTFKAKHVPKWGNPRRMAGWNNKLFVRADLMPHQIRITDVWAEGLHDIKDEDCLKEGIVKRDGMYGFYGNDKLYKTPKEAFQNLIIKMSGKKVWEDEPWVFAYTFELIK